MSRGHTNSHRARRARELRTYPEGTRTHKELTATRTVPQVPNPLSSPCPGPSLRLDASILLSFAKRNSKQRKTSPAESHPPRRSPQSQRFRHAETPPNAKRLRTQYEHKGFAGSRILHRHHVLRSIRAVLLPPGIPTHARTSPDIAGQCEILRRRSSTMFPDEMPSEPSIPAQPRTFASSVG